MTSEDQEILQQSLEAITHIVINSETPKATFYGFGNSGEHSVIITVEVVEAKK